MELNRTTNLASVKNGAPFTWGDVVKIHEIGEYAIVEYHPYNDYTTTEYHCYFKGKDLSRSTTSLDASLAECIAYKHDGVNSQAGNYFMRMIGN